MDANKFSELEWPSKRIPPGGILHPRKVVYSPETQKMLKVIMDEAKLTMLMRKQLNWCLRSGGSLTDITQRNEHQRKETTNIPSIRPRTSRRRSYSDIKKSGDLERERYIPSRKAENREVIKEKLQNVMEFGRESELINTVQKKNKTPIKKPRAIPTKLEILFNLLTQIQDREEWLNEMEALGEGGKHREVINSQIAERIRKIDELNINIDDEMKRMETSSIKSCRSQVSTANSEQGNSARSHYKNFENKEINEIIGLSNRSIDTDNHKNENNSDDRIKVLPSCSKSSKQFADQPLDSKTEKTSREKREEISEKDFGGLFENDSKSYLTPDNKLRKEKMRGFFIEGSSCSLSGKADNVSKKQLK